MRQYHLPYLFPLLLWGLTACQSVATTKTKVEPAVTLEALLQEAIDDSLGEVPGVSMTVIAPQQAIHWVGAAGFADRPKKDSLHTNQPFRIASVTKTFVAAAILRLHETGKLNIDDPLADHISEAHLALLEADGYRTDRITLRHCLQHTSGLYDYAVASPAYLAPLCYRPRPTALASWWWVPLQRYRLHSAGGSH